MSKEKLTIQQSENSTSKGKKYVAPTVFGKAVYLKALISRVRITYINTCI